MNLYYATDLHITDKQPANRLTPVMPHCLKALKELLSVAKDGYLLLGGDLFESPCPSYDLFNQVVKALKTAKCEVFTVFGNHDILYGDFVAENNALRSLINLGLVKELGLDGTQIGGYTVYGVSYRKEIYKNFEDVGLCIKNPNNSIVLTHQFMSDMKLPYNHVRVTDFKTDVPLVLCGHLHKPFDITHAATRFINTGCVCKLNRNEAVFKTSCLRISDNFKTDILNLECETNIEFLQNEIQKSDFVKSISDAKVEKQDIYSFIEQSEKPAHIKELAIKLIKEYQNV